MHRAAAAIAILSLAACSSGTPEAKLPPPTHEVLAAVNLSAGQFTASGTADKSPCTATGAYSAIKQGAVVTVTDPSGAIVGRGTLDAPYTLGNASECRALAKIGIPDAASYTFDVAGVWSESASIDDLAGSQFNWFLIAPAK